MINKLHELGLQTLLLNNLIIVTFYVLLTWNMVKTESQQPSKSWTFKVHYTHPLCETDVIYLLIETIMSGCKKRKGNYLKTTLLRIRSVQWIFFSPDTSLGIFWLL